jgi:hypothetical protein
MVISGLIQADKNQLTGINRSQDDFVYEEYLAELLEHIESF